ncbi:MAG: NUDIX hydrolase [Acetobacteraceae bacterium]|nr:NUDIX hydrolase [Acetobacteraceae bacterium]
MERKVAGAVRERSEGHGTARASRCRTGKAVTDREYPLRPIVGIGVIVFKQDQVLLVRRGKPPNAGSWTLPGGAQEVGESVEEAARRELLEETGLIVGQLHFAAHVDNIRRDKDGRVQFHYTILDFATWWLAGEPIAASDVTEAAWVSLDRLKEFKLWSEAYRVIEVARRLVESELIVASDQASPSGPCPAD